MSRPAAASSASTGHTPVTDPAASYRSRTARQASRAAARFDREAKEVQTACLQRGAAQARARNLARYLDEVERFTPILLRGALRQFEQRALTADEHDFLADKIRFAWKMLRQLGEGIVTVLA